MYVTLTKKSLYRNVLFILTAVLFFSCQKDLSMENGSITQLPDLSTKTNSSVSGFVTDENDAAVKGATVQFGTSTITTDKYGYFEAKNVQVVKNAAFVTVNKQGYFKGIKTYMAREGKAAFFRIKLIPKTTVGNINGSAGGTVTLANGLSIKLPAGAVVNAATNVAYTGTVNVAAFWINPEAADLNQIMPGDLRGINTDGAIKLLQTFGMAAVELTGASGELLQIATGKKATLTLSIPSSLAASAPASIPLWYFDEAKGLWKEEGSATKTGNTYVGDVSHFSFWVYSLPGPYVGFDCTIKDAAGNPIPYAAVQLTIAGTNNYGFGYTDASGFVLGAITTNAQFGLEVFSNFYCSTPTYTQTFTAGNAHVSLGVITITNNLMAIVSGTVTDCSNSPVNNGFIIMRYDGLYFRYTLSNIGTYSFSFPVCNSTPAVTLVAEDLTASQQSILYNTHLVAGANVIGNLQACNISTAEFVNYSINGTSYSVTAPVDSIIIYQSILPYSHIVGYHPGGGPNYTEVTLDGSGIGLNSLQPLAGFSASQLPNTTGILNPITVHITEYGAIGEFVSGNFAGILTDNLPPNTTFNVTCSFRVRRTF